jgi:alpha-tubulin suppressor-like RCC1 family protein
MYLLIRRLILLSLLLFLPAFLTACGNKAENLPSSLDFWGHSAVLDQTGAVWTWGANGNGQLGSGSNNDSITPGKLTFAPMSKIAIGGKQTLALDGAGNLWSWGCNLNGQLGDGTNITRTAPVGIVSLGSNIKSVAAGASHSLAIDASNNVYAWGYNNTGQLGLNTKVDQNTPQLVQGLPLGKVVAAVAAGGDFSLALMDDGTVYAWGNNVKGQLGIINSTVVIANQFFPLPQQVLKLDGVTPLSDIVKIAAGGSHALAIDGNGNIWGWGHNLLGQLGDGTTVDRFGGVQLFTVGSDGYLAKEVSAGRDHSLALIGDLAETVGLVIATGYNYFGQLGNGVSGNYNLYSSWEPEVSDITNFKTIVAVGDHSIAKDANGTYWAWGRNSYGQVGDGTRTDRSLPTELPSIP